MALAQARKLSLGVVSEAFGMPSGTCRGTWLVGELASAGAPNGDGSGVPGVALAEGEGEGEIGFAPGLGV